MQFAVTVQRVEYREHIFFVDAVSRKKAEAAGMTAALDYDFHDSPVDSANESVIGVTRIPSTDKEE